MTASFLRVGVGVVALVLAGGYSRPVFATPLLRTSASVYLAGFDTCGDLTPDPTVAMAACGYDITRDLNGQTRIFATGVGEAKADYGTLEARSFANSLIGDNPGATEADVIVTASATMQDDFTVYGGESGYLRFVFGVSGFNSIEILAGNGVGSALVSAGMTDQFGNNYALTSPVIVLLPYSLGTTTAQFSLGTYARCTVYGGAGCTGESDWFGTVTILGITVLDVNQAVIPGAYFTAASGFQYPTGDLTAVPEPASLALLALGLAGMGARRWRQRNREAESPDCDSHESCSKATLY